MDESIEELVKAIVKQSAMSQEDVRIVADKVLSEIGAQKKLAELKEWLKESVCNESYHRSFVTACEIVLDKIIEKKTEKIYVNRYSDSSCKFGGVFFDELMAKAFGKDDPNYIETLEATLEWEE